MKGICHLLLLILLGTVATQAGEVPTFQPQDPGAEDPGYFPVPVVGSVTEYSVTRKVKGQIEKGTMKMKFEKEEEINGQKYLCKSTNFEGLKDLEKDLGFFRYADDGIHVIDELKKDSADYINPPFPLTMGREWTYLDPSSTVPTRCKVEGIEDVKAGNQTFRDCLKISETVDFGEGLCMVLETWYAPKVGPVKFVSKDNTDGKEEVECLLVKPASQ